MAILRLKNADGAWVDVPEIHGENAYEGAVRNGFTGTEAEFYDQLSHFTTYANQAKDASDRAEEVMDSIPQDYQTLDRHVVDLTEHIVEVSETQPTNEQNKLWIQPTSEEVRVPTYEEFEELRDSVAPIEENSTFSKGYSKGEYFIRDGGLCVTTENVAQGDTITVGTNYTTVPDGVSGEVADLKSALTTKSISILFVGNSLTQDGIAYLPYLLKNFYPKISFKFYIWYNGGYTLAQQYSKFVNEENCQIYSISENSASWTNNVNNTTMKHILQTKTFDIVCMQEYFTSKGSYSLSDLSDWNNCKTYIQENYTGGNGLEFISLFHAPKRDTPESRFNLVKTGNALILQNTISQDMIPIGIAIYRALSTDLDSLGDQGHLSPDGVHTQEGLPCLLQTYVALQWVLDKLSIPKSVYGFPFKMTTEIYNSINVPGPNLGSGVIEGTNAQNLLAQEVAIKAYKEGKQFVVYNEYANS